MDSDATAMALSIRDPATDRLARELARWRRALAAIAARAHQRPVRDERTPGAIIGYDENGLPS